MKKDSKCTFSKSIDFTQLRFIIVFNKLELLQLVTSRYLVPTLINTRFFKLFLHHFVK